MEKISRRRVLRLLPGAGITAGVTTLAFTDAGSGLVPAGEPWTQARCLAGELSRVLAHCDDGQQLAIVQAASIANPVYFGDAVLHAEEAEKDRFARRFHAMVTEGNELERAQFHARELDQVYREHFAGTGITWQANWFGLASATWSHRWREEA